MNTEDPSSISPVTPVASRRRWAKVAVRIGGTVVILSALVAFVSPRELIAAAAAADSRAHAASRLRLSALAPAGLAQVADHDQRGRRRAVLAPLRALLLCWFVCNTFLISLVGGDVVRMGMAIRQARSKAGLLIGSLADRLFDVLGLLVITLAGVLWMPGLLDEKSRPVVSRPIPGRRACRGRRPRGAIALAGTAAAVQGPPDAGPSSRRDPCGAPASASGAPGGRAGDRPAGEPGRHERLDGRRLRPASGVWAWLFAWPLAKIASMLPVSLGGLGVREAALVSLLVPLGADAASVVAAGLAFEAVIIAGGLASGAISMAMSSGLAHRFSGPAMLSAPDRRTDSRFGSIAYPGEASAVRRAADFGRTAPVSNG